MIRQTSKTFFSLSLQNQRGVALLYLIILFTLLGVLVSAGTRMLSSTVSLRMINDTKTALERDVQVITAWASKNRRLPIPAEYPAVFGSVPLDAWGKPLVFAYYSSLTHDNSLCATTSSPINYNGKDAAFLLLSGGDDMNITSKLKTEDPFTTSGPFMINGTMSNDDLLPEDMYRVVTLNELNTLAACYGSTKGRLRIVNNELPKACEGNIYKATIFSDGGVPPINFSYEELPSWLNSTGVHSENLSSSAAPEQSTNTIIVTATDAIGNSVKRSYLLKIDSCPPTP